MNIAHATGACEVVLVIGMNLDGIPRTLANEVTIMWH
jgi:hypothetical protein